MASPRTLTLLAISMKGRPMGYKTILVHVDDSRHVDERIRIAARIAAAEGAHLIGAAMTGVSRFVYRHTDLNENDPNIAAHIELLREGARAALAAFEPRVKSLGVTSYEQRLIDDDAGSGLTLQASYSDLVVVGQTDPEEMSLAKMPELPAHVVMNAGRPVLIVPYAGHFDNLVGNVLIAWDGSTQATRAVTSAIPLLKRATIAKVVIFNADENPGIHGEQPGADIALYLARHNVNVEVLQKKTVLDIGNALLTLVADEAADLLVMGGYGHSRFREVLLGGATRTVLASMTVPVLMSH